MNIYQPATTYSSTRNRAFGALAWLVLIAMVARTTLFIRQRSTSQFDTVDSSAAIAVALVGIGFLLFAFSPRGKRVLRELLNGSSSTFAFYCFLSALSAIWSLNPEFTLFRGAEIFAVYLVALLAMSASADFFTAEKAFLRFGVLVIALDVGSRLRGGAVSLDDLHTNLFSAVSGMYFCTVSLNTFPQKESADSIYSFLRFSS